MAMFKNYVKIARPDHWFKNFFMAPGLLLALWKTGDYTDVALLYKAPLAILSVCFIASANYVINEWLDAEFDKHHPKKKARPSVSADLKAKWVYLEYAALAIVGLGAAYFINWAYFFVTVWFFVMGVLYNVRPFRTKERVYVDVLSESINNPIRLLLGWYIIGPDPLPPSSILLSYWMGGAFLMGAKRFAEYRLIGDPEMAGRYRASFKYYTEQKLLISTVFYALTSAFFLGIFLVKHKIELILSFPFFAALFAWYLAIAFRNDSPVQNPEKLYKEYRFMLFVAFLAVLCAVLVYLDIPQLAFLIEK